MLNWGIQTSPYVWCDVHYHLVSLRLLEVGKACQWEESPILLVLAGTQGPFRGCWGEAALWCAEVLKSDEATWNHFWILKVNTQCSVCIWLSIEAHFSPVSVQLFICIALCLTRLVMDQDHVVLNAVQILGGVHANGLDSEAVVIYCRK